MQKREEKRQSDNGQPSAERRFKCRLCSKIKIKTQVGTSQNSKRNRTYEGEHPKQNQQRYKEKRRKMSRSKASGLNMHCPSDPITISPLLPDMSNQAVTRSMRRNNLRAESEAITCLPHPIVHLIVFRPAQTFVVEPDTVEHVSPVKRIRQCIHIAR